MARSTRRLPAVRMRADGTSTSRPDTLAGEEPLEIRLDGDTWLVTMRTPGHDVDLVHGLLLGEGVIQEAGQVRQVTYGPGVEANGLLSYNLVDVALLGAVRPQAAGRAVYTSASCGVCGTASMDAIAKQSRHPVPPPGPLVDRAVLLGLPAALRHQQPLFDRTGGVHAAALFEPAGTLIAAREDVGRHNAVDKVLGHALRHGQIPAGRAILQLSGRVSYELVQKASMAGVPVVAAVSAPSGAAVDLAHEVGITVVGFSRETSMQVYTHPERII